MQVDRIPEFDPTAPVTEQASAWWVLLNEGDAVEADHQAFAEWVVRSPERVSAYLQAARVSHVFRSSRTQWPDTPADELIRMASASNLPFGQLQVASDLLASAPAPALTACWPSAVGEERASQATGTQVPASLSAYLNKAPLVGIRPPSHLESSVSDFAAAAGD